MVSSLFWGLILERWIPRSKVFFQVLVLSILFCCPTRWWFPWSSHCPQIFWSCVVLWICSRWIFHLPLDRNSQNGFGLTHPLPTINPPGPLHSLSHVCLSNIPSHHPQTKHSVKIHNTTSSTDMYPLPPFTSVKGELDIDQRRVGRFCRIHLCDCETCTYSSCKTESTCLGEEERMTTNNSTWTPVSGTSKVYVSPPVIVYVPVS
jgi:hypothetical protein